MGKIASRGGSRCASALTAILPTRKEPPIGPRSITSFRLRMGRMAERAQCPPETTVQSHRNWNFSARESNPFGRLFRMPRAHGRTLHRHDVPRRSPEPVGLGSAQRDDRGRRGGDGPGRFRCHRGSCQRHLYEEMRSRLEGEPMGLGADGRQEDAQHHQELHGRRPYSLLRAAAAAIGRGTVFHASGRDRRTQPCPGNVQHVRSDQAQLSVDHTAVQETGAAGRRRALVYDFSPPHRRVLRAEDPRYPAASSRTGST